MGRGQPWATTKLPEGISHLDWLKANAAKYTKKEIAERLGRSVPSVEGQLRRLELKCLSDTAVLGVEEDIEEVYGIEVADILKFLKNKPRSLTDLSTKFDRSADTMKLSVEELQERHYEIMQTDARRYLWSTKAPGIVSPPTALWGKPTWSFKFGVISDAHFASTASQISGLIKAIDIMYERGVRDVLFCGDLTAGQYVYPGQGLDLVSELADEQKSLVVTYWPRREGMRFFMMGGNHDWSFVKRSGFNIVKSICDDRDDFTYLGYDLATVPLTPDIDALLWHPSGGVPYAMSYRLQKQAEQVATEQLMQTLEESSTPRIRFLFAGHLHILVEFWQGPIFCAQVGCFEGQTNYLKKKALYPQLAALVLNVELTRDRNLIRELGISHFRFTEIKNDYLSYPVIPDDVVVEPIFEWVVEEDKKE